MNQTHDEYDQHQSTVSESNASSELEPTSPQMAVNLYLSSKKNEVADSTHTTIERRLKRFIEWCDDEDIEDTTQLTGRTLYQYRLALQNNNYGDYEPYTVQAMVSAMKTFIGFCERINAAHGGLSEKVLVPSVDSDEKSRDTVLESARASEIREHLRKYRWSSRTHVIFEILWSTGMRVGGLHSLDVEDFDSDDQLLRLKHRPNRESTLKNGTDGERPVTLSDTLTEIIMDYIQTNRIDATDDHGRKPLVTSEHGRYSKSALRNSVQSTTLPCMMGPCPHSKDPNVCEWTNRYTAFKCPSSRSPHDLRRGVITHLRNQKDVPTKVISDRTNVSREVLEESYDKRTEDDKAELRREYLKDMDL